MEKTLWEIYNDTQLAELETLTADYKDFLDAGKTERECVTEVIRLAEKEGYVDLNQKDTLQAGDKVYLDWMGKSIVLFQIGEDPLENGMNILGAHVDSPRLDLKQNPLYEESGFAYFDTHYYGGIKKYQWVTLPLAIHGVVVKKRWNKIQRSDWRKRRRSNICDHRPSATSWIQTDGKDSGIRHRRGSSGYSGRKRTTLW